MATLGPWDTVFGVDAAAMNTLLTQVHTLMPKLVNFYWDLGADTINSIGIHFADAPQLISQGGQLQLVAPLRIEVTGSQGGEFSGQVTVDLVFEAINNDFWSSISSVSFQIFPENDAVLMFLNDGGAELMQGLLGTQLLEPLGFAIPAPPGQHVGFASSIAGGDDDPFFICYTAEQQFTLPDSNANWPQAGAFLAITGAHVAGVLAPLVTSLSGQGGIDSPNFSWTFGLQTQIEVSLTSTGGPQLFVHATTDASVTYHTPGAFPNVGFTAPVTADFATALNFTATPGAGGPTLSMQVGALGMVNVAVDLSGAAALDPTLVDSIQAPLGDDVIQTIRQALLGPTTFFTIAPQALSFPGQPPVTLSLTNPTAQCFQGPDSVGVIALVGTPTLALS